jgi:WD40 repeat protein
MGVFQMIRRVGGLAVVALVAGGFIGLGAGAKVPSQRVGAAPGETTTLGTTIPETTIPETTIPETTIPETTIPETTIPETTIPETTTPETVIEGSGSIIQSVGRGPAIMQLGSEIIGERLEDSGSAIAISADGNVLAIGAPSAASDGPGLVRVYRWVGSDWAQAGPSIGGNSTGDRFGASVALSADGERLAVGAPDTDEYRGLVQVFDWEDATSSWTRAGADLAFVGSQAGSAVGLSASGDRLAIGSANGTVAVFDWDATNGWRQAGDDISPSGRSTSPHIAISMSAVGSHLAVGAGASDPELYSDNPTLLYGWNDVSGTWGQIGPPAPIEGAGPGKSVALSATGERLVIGIPSFGPPWTSNPGRILVFDWDDTLESWVQAGAELSGEGTWYTFGSAAAISANGGRMAVGAPLDADSLAGHVRIYDWDHTRASWWQIAVEVSGHQTFGGSLAFSDDGTRLAIGAPYEGNGVVRVFEIETASPTVPRPTDELPRTGAGTILLRLAIVVLATGTVLVVASRQRRPAQAQSHRLRRATAMESFAANLNGSGSCAVPPPPAA